MLPYIIIIIIILAVLIFEPNLDSVIIYKYSGYPDGKWYLLWYNKFKTVDERIVKQRDYIRLVYISKK